MTPALLFKSGVLQSNPKKWGSYHSFLLSDGCFPYNWRTDLKHLEAISSAMDALRLGSKEFLYVSAPPRHGKSETLTIRGAVYVLENDPTAKILIVCHTLELALEFSMRIKDLFYSRGKWGKGDKDRGDYWTTECGGCVYACGIEAPPTGRGFNWIFADDLIKKIEDAQSPTFRQKQMSQWTVNIMSRRAPGCKTVLTATRWDTDDLPGRLLLNDAEYWDKLIMPAIAGENDPLGRKPGEPLAPEIGWTTEALSEIRKGYERQGIGRHYKALYQCDPVNQEGGLFKDEYFHNFVELHEIPTMPYIVRAWDLATGVKQENDFTVGALVGVDASLNMYILDIMRFKAEFPDVRKRIEEQAELDNTEWSMRLNAPIHYAIESQGNQLAMIQELQRVPISYKIAFHPIRWEGSVSAGNKKKEAATPWAMRASVGKLKMIKAAWNAPFVEECLRFRGVPGDRDDQVDAVSLAMLQLHKLSPSPAEPFVIPGSWEHIQLLEELQYGNS